MTGGGPGASVPGPPPCCARVVCASRPIASPATSPAPMRTRGVCTSLVETAVSGYRPLACARCGRPPVYPARHAGADPRARAVSAAEHLPAGVFRPGPPRAGGVSRTCSPAGSRGYRTPARGRCGRASGAWGLPLACARHMKHIVATACAAGFIPRVRAARSSSIPRKCRPLV